MAKAFVRSPELLYELADKINNRELLYNLCLVNSTFNGIFSKQLYKVVRFTARDGCFLYSVMNRRHMLRSKYLRWLETLIIFLPVEPRSECPEDNLALCMFIANLVTRSRCLKSFACGELWPTAGLLEALQSASSLESFSWQVPQDWEHPSNPLVNVDSFDNFACVLSNFRGLQRLSLLSIRGANGPWENLICDLLVRNPNLKRFNFSINHEDIHQHSVVVGTSLANCATYPLMLQHACALYAQREKRKLRLEVLHLGPHVFLPGSDKFDYGNLVELYFYTNGWEVEYQGGSWSDEDDNSEYDDDHDPHTNPRPVHWRSPTPLSLSLCGSISEKEKRAFLGYCWTMAGRLRHFNIHSYDVPNRYLIQCNKIPKEQLDRGTEVPVLQLPARFNSLVDFQNHQVSSFVTHLVIQLKQDGRNRKGCKMLALDQLKVVITHLTQLEALWVHGIALDCEQYVEVFHDGEARARLAFDMAIKNSSLSYIRLDDSAWKIRRSSLFDVSPVIQLVHLDEWEDELEGPALFHAPQLVIGAWQLNHTYR